MIKKIFFLFLGLSFYVQGQNLFLASQYLEEGQQDKALLIYQEWFEKHHSYNPQVYDNVLDILIRKGTYNRALDWIKQNQRLAQTPLFEADKYHLYRLTGNENKANKILEKLIQNVLSQPAYISLIHYRLKKYNYLNETIRLLLEAGQIHPNAHYYLLLGNTYAEMGDMKKMTGAYLEALGQNESYYYYILSSLSKYVEPSPENPYNQILKQNLVESITRKPDPVYLKLLQWLYVQENNYHMAFVQLRALLLQQAASIPEILNLAETALTNQQFEAAAEMLDFVKNQQNLNPSDFDRLQLLLSKWENETSKRDLTSVWRQRLMHIRNAKIKFELSKLIINRLIYQTKNYDKAREIIDSLKTKTYSGKYLSFWKEKEADILLFEKKFDKAAIQYTILRQDFPYEDINYRALYKIALASFFQGDFDWAHTTLKTLKKAADKKIANDALLLDFIIISNREKNDSLQTGLKTFAKIYFDYYTRDYSKALDKIQRNKTAYKGQKIYDDLVYLQAKIIEKTGSTEKTENLWKELLSIHTDKIYHEEALFKLGIILEKKGMTEKAKTYFKQILENYPQGFWYEKAQKHFRNLIESKNRLP